MATVTILVTLVTPQVPDFRATGGVSGDASQVAVDAAEGTGFDAIAVDCVTVRSVVIKFIGPAAASAKLKSRLQESFNPRKWVVDFLV